MALANADIQRSVALDGESKMVNFGAQLAAAMGKIDSPLLILLNGDLGAGKTTISRGILQGLGHQGAVKSPTYTLVEPYQLAIGKIYHFDLYRLTDPEELEHIGFSDYLSEAKLCIIEWPENGGSYIPLPDLSIGIQLNGSGRQVTLDSSTESGKRCINLLQQ
ncbi:MAG: tRNA (adenosine(37)-N6)-threonylcarbamoyltransferase complex ATPase subunit type 1 TsaE [Porticoccaceae bacterium]